LPDAEGFFVWPPFKSRQAKSTINSQQHKGLPAEPYSLAGQ
jgi:hypothetical protein